MGKLRIRPVTLRKFATAGGASWGKIFLRRVLALVFHLNVVYSFLVDTVRHIEKNRFFWLEGIIILQIFSSKAIPVQ